jgi:hypothetical protein
VVNVGCFDLGFIPKLASRGVVFKNNAGGGLGFSTTSLQSCFQEFIPVKPSSQLPKVFKGF